MPAHPPALVMTELGSSHRRNAEQEKKKKDTQAGARGSQQLHGDPRENKNKAEEIERIRRHPSIATAAGSAADCLLRCPPPHTLVASLGRVSHAEKNIYL